MAEIKGDQESKRKNQGYSKKGKKRSSFLLRGLPFLLMLLVIFVTPGKNLAPAEQCEEDVEVYQDFSRDELKEILKKLNRPGAKIMKIRMSPIEGLWEIAFEDKGQFGVFYLDFSKVYLLTGPIIDFNAGVDKTRERLNELVRSRRIDPSRIPLGEALILGDKEAAKRVVVFTDPDCPFCGKFHAEIKKVVAKRKDIAFYIKLFPLQIHPDAYWKSKSIICNKSLKYLEDNFEKKPIPKPGPDCQTKDVDENIKLASELGINGTPTSIFPDGSIHPGLLEAERLIEKIDSSSTNKK